MLSLASLFLPSTIIPLEMMAASAAGLVLMALWYKRRRRRAEERREAERQSEASELMAMLNSAGVHYEWRKMKGVKGGTTLEFELEDDGEETRLVIFCFYDGRLKRVESLVRKN